jgi:hypothetical protein
MSWRRRTIAVALGLAAVLPAGAAWAQDTRVEAITAEQAEKSKEVKPYEVGAWENIADAIESGRWLNPAFTHGFFPTFETVYPGGGFNIGGGWRAFTGYDSYIDFRGVYSVKGYKLGEARVKFPNAFSGRLATGVRAGWRDATQVGFWGVGNETDVNDRANFRVQQTVVEAGFEFRTKRWLFLEGAGAYEDFTEQEGLGSFPSIEERYDATTAPNLGTDPTYARVRGAAGFNWLTSPGYSRRGGLIRVAHDEYYPVADTAGGNFGLTRVEAVQHLPMFRETWVLSLRGRGETVSSNLDDVPYFLLPWLGSGNTLRAYETARFRDRSTMLYSAELRWMANRRVLDVAIFADAGNVAEDVEHLRFKNMTTDYGIGVRFHTPGLTLLRVEYAQGSEGWRIVTSTGAAF